MNLTRLAWKSAGLSRRRLAIRVAELALLSLLVLAVLALFGRAPEPGPVNVFESVPAGTTGLYELEHFDSLTYRWTAGSVHMHFAQFALKRPYELRLLVSTGSRPPQAAAPNVTITVNGKDVLTFHASPEWQTVHASLEPQGLNLSNDLDLVLSVPPFVPSEVMPGSQDTRSLGVMVQQIELHSTAAAGSLFVLPPTNVMLVWLLVSWLVLAFSLDRRFGLSWRRRWTVLVIALASLAVAYRLTGQAALDLAGLFAGGLLIVWLPLHEAASIFHGARTGTAAWSQTQDPRGGSPSATTAVLGSGRTIPQLDGIRGLAILLVLGYHYLYGPLTLQLASSSGVIPDLVRSALPLGWSGVDLFFVLSGFLIGGILIDNRASPAYFRTFYIRRTFRIFPIYFVALFVFGFLGLLFSRYFADSRLATLFSGDTPLWTFVTFTQNIAVAVNNSPPAALASLWSLGVEEQFYIGLSLLVALLSPRKLPYVLVALIVLAPILRLVLISASQIQCLACYVLTPTRADSLLLGVLGAYALRQPRRLGYLQARLSWVYVLLTLFLLGAILLSYVAMTAPGGGAAFINASIGYSWLAGLHLCFLMLTVLDSNGALGRFAAWGPLRQLGKLAFGIYIFHGPVFLAIYILASDNRGQLSELTFVLVIGLALLITLSAAYASWRFFEKKFVAWGHRFGYGATGANTLPVELHDGYSAS